ncbi:hypothetical protein K525DRAFT_202296 [Schizophyllum commune Loenen D]|nr:hypothetical protein K525DRAFT_202296 [Schizophyllum commune Loenen D]
MRRFLPALLAFVSPLVNLVHAAEVTLYYVSTDGDGTSLAHVQSRTISPLGTAEDGSLTTYVEVEEVSYTAWVEGTSTVYEPPEPVETLTYTFVEGAASFGYTDTVLQTSTSTITGADGQPTSTDTETWTAGVTEACQFDADTSIGSCEFYFAEQTVPVSFTGSLMPYYTMSVDDSSNGATRGSPASLAALCSVAAGVGLGAWMTMAQAF